MTLPLEGVRICDLSWLVSGAWGTRQLAGLGAEVIRVEWRSNLDSLRRRETLPLPEYDQVALPPAERQPSVNRGGGFNNVNVGKYGVALNIKHDKGKEIFTKLIAASDVVIENFTAHTLEKWGFGYEVLKQIRPDIIYVQLPGYGSYGPYVDYRAYGLINQAFSGLSNQSGQPDRDQPSGWGYGYMDTMVGVYNSLAVMTALHYRNRTGKGQYIDMAQSEMGITITGAAYLDKQVNGRNYQRTGNRSPYLPAAPHGAYRCAGRDNWVAIACYTEDEWQSFRKAVGEPKWADDPKFATLDGRMKNQDELDRFVNQWTTLHNKHEVMHHLQRCGVPAGTVQTPQDLMENDQALRARDYLVWLKHTEAGMWSAERIVGNLSETPSHAGGLPDRHAPCYGEDTDHVLGNVLGYSDADIKEFREEGAVE